MDSITAIVNGFHSLTAVAMFSILDVWGFLVKPLQSQSWNVLHVVFLLKTINITKQSYLNQKSVNKCTQVRSALSGLKHFLATKSPLKMMKNALFSFSRYLNFCLKFLVIKKNGLIRKIKVNFKIYVVTTSEKATTAMHIIVQYLKM